MQPFCFQMPFSHPGKILLMLTCIYVLLHVHYNNSDAFKDFLKIRYRTQSKDGEQVKSSTKRYENIMDNLKTSSSSSSISLPTGISSIPSTSTSSNTEASLGAMTSIEIRTNIATGGNTNSMADTQSKDGEQVKSSIKHYANVMDHLKTSSSSSSISWPTDTSSVASTSTSSNTEASLGAMASIKMRTNIATGGNTIRMADTSTKTQMNAKTDAASHASTYNITNSRTDMTFNKDTCKEQTSLYFLKVHKAGSTCIQNLFWRFGVSRSLSFMVFKNHFPYPNRDFRSFLLPDPKVEMFDGRYDIFCEHSIFNDAQIKSKMKADTEYSAILREPLSKLRSALKFYGYARQHNLGGDVDLAEHFLMSDKNTPGRQTAREFGYTPGTDIQVFFKDIDIKFKVIAILEQLDESLVLMKRRYCWKFKDILYLPMRQSNYTITKDTGKENELNKRLRRRNEIDYLLYEYFVNRHNTQVSKEENDFAGEVELFMKISDKTKAFCSDVCRQLGDGISRNASHEQLMEHLSSVVTFPASHWEPAFTISGVECIMMVFGVRVWRNAQRVTQYPEFCTGETKDPKLDMNYCKDHFAYSFPWYILYNSHKEHGTFLFPCY